MGIEDMNKILAEKEKNHMESKSEKPKVKDGTEYTEIEVNKLDPRVDFLMEKIGRLEAGSDYSTVKADIETLKAENEAIKAVLGTTLDITYCKKCGVGYSVLKVIKDRTKEFHFDFSDKPIRFEFECPHCETRSTKLTIRSTGEVVKASDVGKKLEADKVKKEKPKESEADKDQEPEDEELEKSEEDE
jgi:hypothetical protein